MRRIKTLGLALLLSLSFLPAALSAKEQRNTYNNAWSADEREGRDRDRNGGYYNQREVHRNRRLRLDDRGGHCSDLLVPQVGTACPERDARPKHRA